MRPFKFLKCPLAIAHDGGYIYSGEVFYTMNKEDRLPIKPGRSIIPKYTIVRRTISKKYQKVFKPDYEGLWYFKSKLAAEWLREIWRRK
jgi:hypothetical protein